MLWWTLRQLRSPVVETRLTKLNQLVQEPDARTLPTLTALVESDPSPGVRAIAVQALAQFGKDAPLQTIRLAINMADEVAVESCDALGKLRDPLAASPLREVLLDSG